MLNIAAARPPFVEYKQVAFPDTKRTLELGYRVTKDVDMAFVMHPGSRDVLEIKAQDWLLQLRNKMLTGAHDAYPQEWVDQLQKKYDLWKQGLEAPVNGTHVKEWAALSPAQVQNLVAMNVLTVEDVAAMTEEALGRMMGSRLLRDQAREWLAKRDLAGNALKENDELKAQVAALTARIEAMEAKPAEAPEQPEEVPFTRPKLSVPKKAA